MAEPKLARSSGGPNKGAQAAPAPLRRTTQRVAPLGRSGGELPGWIWAGLGCLSVLAAGFSVMFLVVSPAAELPPAATVKVAPSAPTAAAETAAPTAPTIHVVPIAPAPAATPAPTPVAHRPKPARPAAPKAVRVARSPSTVPAPDKVDSAEGASEADEEELLKPQKPRSKTRAAAPPADTDEESDTGASE